jgi:hypothetical protein
MMLNVIPLPTELATSARTSERDDYGNVLTEELQTSFGNPCRHCLRRANPGERLILFSHSPFDRENPYKEVGPVFVHANECERYERRDTLPEDFSGPIVLRGYDHEQCIARVNVVVDGQTKRRAEELLADPSIDFVHARSLTHGCYLFRIERAA